MYVNSLSRFLVGHIPMNWMMVIINLMVISDKSHVFYMFMETKRTGIKRTEQNTVLGPRF